MAKLKCNLIAHVDETINSKSQIPPNQVTFWADIPRFARRFCRVEESPQPGGGAKEDFASISCRT